MPRYGRVPKRRVAPDVVYNSGLVQRFINKLILRGKKATVENIFYRSMEAIKAKTNQDPLKVFEKALENLTPLLEVKARRVGGATYQIPVEISRERAQAIAMQWLRDVARERPGKSMAENLSAEIVDAFNGTGAAMKNRENLHKSAEANKAFAHFRW